MRSLLASLLLVPLISCGDSSSKGKKSGGSSNDDTAIDDSVYVPDFEAIVARCSTADAALDTASYDCCIERTSWNDGIDEAWCDNNLDNGRDESYNWVGTGEQYCDIDWLKEIYNNLLDWDPPASPECIDYKLNKWIDYMDCAASSYAPGCATEPAYETVVELGDECFEEVWNLDDVPC